MSEVEEGDNHRPCSIVESENDKHSSLHLVATHTTTNMSVFRETSLFDGC